MNDFHFKLLIVVRDSVRLVQRLEFDIEYGLGINCTNIRNIDTFSLSYSVQAWQALVQRLGMHTEDIHA